MTRDCRTRQSVRTHLKMVRARWSSGMAPATAGPGTSYVSRFFTAVGARLICDQMPGRSFACVWACRAGGSSVPGWRWWHGRGSRRTDASCTSIICGATQLGSAQSIACNCTCSPGRPTLATSRASSRADSFLVPPCHPQLAHSPGAVMRKRASVTYRLLAVTPWKGVLPPPAMSATSAAAGAAAERR